MSGTGSIKTNLWYDWGIFASEYQTVLIDTGWMHKSNSGGITDTRRLYILEIGNNVCILAYTKLSYIFANGNYITFKTRNNEK